LFGKRLQIILIAFKVHEKYALESGAHTTLFSLGIFFKKRTKIELARKNK